MHLGLLEQMPKSVARRFACMMSSRQFEPFLHTGKEHSPIAFAADCGTRVREDEGCRQRSLRLERATSRH